jgi:hypothetical protein
MVWPFQKGLVVAQLTIKPAAIEYREALRIATNAKYEDFPAVTESIAELQRVLAEIDLENEQRPLNMATVGRLMMEQIETGIEDEDGFVIVAWYHGEIDMMGSQTSNNGNEDQAAQSPSPSLQHEATIFHTPPSTDTSLSSSLASTTSDEEHFSPFIDLSGCYFPPEVSPPTSVSGSDKGKSLFPPFSMIPPTVAELLSEARRSQVHKEWEQRRSEEQNLTFHKKDLWNEEVQIGDDFGNDLVWKDEMLDLAEYARPGRRNHVPFL